MLLLLAACSPPVEPPASAVPAPHVEVEPPSAVEIPPSFQEIGAATPRLDGAVPASKASPRTVAFVQTDKPLYAPGETVWVATRRLDAELAAPPVAKTGKPAYFVLIDPRGGTVDEKLVEDRSGVATNDFVLPAGAAGGVWTVRADLPDGVRIEREIVVVGHEATRFQKKLDFLRKAYVPGDTVVATVSVKAADGEPLAARPLTARIRVGGQDLPAEVVTTDARGDALVRFTLPDAVNGDDSSLTVLVSDAGLTESISRRIPIDQDSLSVALFPEGGELVAGLPSRVYFAATRADGKPGDVSGRVVDDLGRTQATFASFHHGLGRFALTPVAGRTYHLELRGSGRKVPLPTARAAGCVLSTPDDFDTRSREVRAEVRCSDARDVAVTAELRGRRLDGGRVRVTPGRASRVYLDPGTAAAAAGPVRVTLFDTNDQPIAERAVFRNRGRQLHLDVKARGEGFGPRDEVTLDVTATDPDGKPVAADVSLAVVDDGALTWADDKQGDIVSAMLLESEIPGRIEDPRSFFAEPTGYALDLLLGTSGWRTFRPVEPAPEVAATRARVEEGKVGKKDARMARAGGDKVRRAEVDREVARDAGVLGALRDDAQLDMLLGQPAREVDLALGADELVGIGGLIGTRGLGGGGLGQGFPDAGTRTGGFGRVGPGSGGVADTGNAIILGALDKSNIDAVIKRNLSQIRYCYQRELTRDPTLAGKVTVKFVIAKDGTVSSATTRTSTLNSVPVESCINSRFLRFRFPEPKGGGIVIVSYPFLFSPEGAPFAIASARDEPVFAPVRTFAAPANLGAARTDFRETVAWVPSLRTDAKGRATARFTLSDAVTSFRATVQGAGTGMVGRGDAVIAATLPFSMQVRLPVAAAIGDRLRIPLTLTNTRATALDVRVESSLGEARRVTLEPRAASTLFYDLEAKSTGPVRFSAASAGLTDAFERTLTVVDPGFPRSWSASGRLEGEVEHTLTVDDPKGEGTTAWIAAYADPLPTLTEGLEGLLRLPTGCFEQASSVNYPNLLVLQLLEHGSASPELAARSRELLDQGYRKLVGYESRGGGYEWFGGFPAHGALTAYGLAEFTQMRGVYGGVDADMLARTREWLLSRRDGKGGWLADDRALDSFGHASKEVTDAYILWALATSGSAGDVASELAAAAGNPASDPYRLALQVDALARPRPDDAARLAEALVTRQDADGAWRGARESITRSGGRNLHIETTALAVRALLDVGSHAGAADAGVRWLLTQRDDTGRWGSTQGTILTLDALTRYASRAPATGPGTAVVTVDGREAGTLRWGPGIAQARLELPLTTGGHAITVRAKGAPVPYTLGASWSTRLPPSASGRLALTTSLATDRVDLGEPVRLTATVSNTTSEGMPMVVAEIGIPAGLEAQTWQLRELVDTHVVDLFETRDDRVYLYWRSFEPSATRTVPLDLLAVVPGTSTAPASDAWLYYDDDQKAWAAPLEVRVSPG